MTLNPQDKEQTMNIKVKRIQNTRKAGHLAVASVELVDGEGDSLAISRIGICQDYQGSFTSPGRPPFGTRTKNPQHTFCKSNLTANCGERSQVRCCRLTWNGH
jgi:hypothetical protein